MSTESPPPPLPLLSRYDEDAEAENCVEEIIDSIWEGVGHEISSLFVRAVENPLMAEVAMYKLYEVVHLATVQHDGDVVPDEVLELLQPDEEPSPSPIDSWARGAVPARFVKGNETRFKEDLGSDGTRTPSVSSYRSGSTRSRSTISRALSSRGGTRQAAAMESEAPRIVELDDEYASHNDVSNMNSTGHMYDMLQRQKNRLKQLTHTDDTVKDEFQLLQEEVDRASEDLKGKNYIFDQSGNIVLIQPLKSEHLPPFSFKPGLNVNDDGGINDDSKKKLAASRKKKKIRVAGSRGVDEHSDRAMFVPTRSLATTIAGTSQDMTLNNGVAIETNKISKEGPPIPEDPRKPSRKEYFNRKTNTLTTSLDSSWDDNMDGGTLNVDSQYSSDFNDSSAMERSSTFVGGKRFKEINPLEGGRLKPKSVTEQKPPSRTSEDNIHDTKVGRQQPPIEPIKPTTAQQVTVDLLHGGSHMQGPRDRLPNQVLQTRAEKKRYVVPTRSITDEGSAHSSVYSANSKKSGTIKKERVARELF